MGFPGVFGGGSSTCVFAGGFWVRNMVNVLSEIWFSGA